MKISVPDFSAPIGARVFKFCVDLQVGKVYCVNENKDVNSHFAFFFQFFIFPSFTPMKISVANFLVPIVASIFKFCVHLQVG